MGIEIERKFLVNKDKWDASAKPQPKYFRQGYLHAEPHKTIRVRQTSTEGFLTIKGISEGASRIEFEYKIPVLEAAELLNNFAVSELSKNRFELHYADKLWEVDEFLGDNEGLIVAEIELTFEDEAFELPEWAGQEVTGDEKYYNSSLAEKPFKRWEV